jgi:hypothetical protein
MTYQQLLITICWSVGLLHDFFYIKRVEMLDIEELAYVSLPPEMPNYTTDKLIIFSCGSETYLCYILRHIKCILIFNWPPSNLSDWVIDCCLAPTYQFFGSVIARTSKFSMRWWWGSLCFKPTRLVGYLKCYLTETSVRG